MSSQYSDDTNSRTPLYDVLLYDCGSAYAKSIYDLDGTKLLSKEGRALNVFTTELRDMLLSKEVIYCRSYKYDYTYFATSRSQIARFMKEREEGSPERGKKYYVYFDYTD